MLKVEVVVEQCGITGSGRILKKNYHTALSKEGPLVYLQRSLEGLESGFSRLGYSHFYLDKLLLEVVTHCLLRKCGVTEDRPLSRSTVVSYRFFPGDSS